MQKYRISSNKRLPSNKYGTSEWGNILSLPKPRGIWSKYANKEKMEILFTFRYSHLQCQSFES